MYNKTKETTNRQRVFFCMKHFDHAYCVNLDGKKVTKVYLKFTFLYSFLCFSKLRYVKYECGKSFLSLPS